MKFTDAVDGISKELYCERSSGTNVTHLLIGGSYCYKSELTNQNSFNRLNILAPLSTMLYILTVSSSDF